MKWECVVVDYGHGEDTPGKRYRFTDHQDFECKEWITNRMTAAGLIKLLIGNGYKVYDPVADQWWTKELISDDWSWEDLHKGDVPLNTRVARANKIKKSFLISCHSNAVGKSSSGPSINARGGLMYTSPGNTSSDKIAQSLHESFVRAFEGEGVWMRKGDTSDGDNDNEANFTMLTKTASPAVLGEMLFFVNIDDARYLMSERGQAVIAQAYFDGIVPFLTKEEKEPLLG